MRAIIEKMALNIQKTLHDLAAVVSCYCNL
jgi:hypothetical protein